jgi:hypothetical protein
MNMMMMMMMMMTTSTFSIVQESTHPLSLDRVKNLVMIPTPGLTERLTECHYDLDLYRYQRVVQAL